ncbi:MAG: hypothetical protein K2J34_00445 [Muribaculaceae bacterium]|nr:hypothetical protein [Muribaculaceae bacterium]
MVQNFVQVAYREGVFQFDSNAFQKDKTIGVGLNPIMKTDSMSEDLLSLQLTVDYECEGRKVMKYGGVAMFKVDGLKDSLNTEEFKIFIWSQVMMFFRGIVCEKLRGTEIERLLLPNIPHDKILEIPIQES